MTSTPPDPHHLPSRRGALAAAVAIGGAALLLPGCAKSEKNEGKKGGEEAEEVGASEDMMREHGVLRRILVVYRASAELLRQEATKIDAHQLVAAADLFRAFGEDYHEHKLEEAHVFPAVKKAGGPAAALVDTLIAQHARGRDINAFVVDRSKTGIISAGDKVAVADALDGFARMYEKHAAIEDTVIFQAWRKSLSPEALKDAGETFEDIEKAQFKGDGFDIAVDRIAAIERALGFGDLATFTAPPPPHLGSNL